MENVKEESLILNLENALLALEERVGTDEVWGYVNCILKGFISNGVFTEEYIRLAEQALMEKKQMERTLSGHPSQIITSIR